MEKIHIWVELFANHRRNDIHRAIDWNGVADALGVLHFQGDHADYLSVLIAKHAARISGVYSRARLQKSHFDVFYRHLSVERADNTVGNCSAKLTERISDSKNVLSYFKIFT